MIGDRDLAQDVVQETYLRLYKHHEAHRPISVGWLYAVTRNLCRDALRQRRRIPELFAMEPEDTTPAFEGTITKSLAIRETLATLSPRDRECLWLYYYADFSTNDLAHALRISKAAVRARLHRARQRFAENWEEPHAEKS